MEFVVVADLLQNNTDVSHAHGQKLLTPFAEKL